MSHLKTVNLTYFQHLRGALYFSFQSFKASVVFFIHGFFPDYLIYTGSNIIESLNNNLQELINNPTHNKFS